MPTFWQLLGPALHTCGNHNNCRLCLCQIPSMHGDLHHVLLFWFRFRPRLRPSYCYWFVTWWCPLVLFQFLINWSEYTLLFFVIKSKPQRSPTPTLSFLGLDPVNVYHLKYSYEQPICLCVDPYYRCLTVFLGLPSLSTHNCVPDGSQKLISMSQRSPNSISRLQNLDRKSVSNPKSHNQQPWLSNPLSFFQAFKPSVYLTSPARLRVVPNVLAAAY